MKNTNNLEALKEQLEKTILQKQYHRSKEDEEDKKGLETPFSE